MAEILIKARASAGTTDPAKLARSWKRGMPVCVQPDGHPWGVRERLPRFVVLKLPGIAVSRVLQFLGPYEVDDGLEDDGETVRRRIAMRALWQLRWAELPAAVRNKIAATGQLVIGPAASGADYTWAQVRTFLRRNDTDAPAPESI